MSSRIDAAIDIETGQPFQMRWKQLGNQLSKDLQSLQLFQCASEALGYLLDQYNGCGGITDNPPVVAMKPLERMSVIPASKRITRVELMKMSQGNDEPIRTFAAKVQNKAKICGFQMQSKCSCDLTIDYTQEVVKDVILAGIADNEIKIDILEVKGIEEKSIDDIVELIEQKENGMKVYGSSDASTMSSINHSQSQVVNSSSVIPATSNNDLIRSCDEDVTNVAVEQTSHATTPKFVCDEESSSSTNSDEEMEANETGRSLGSNEQKKIHIERQRLQEQQILKQPHCLTSLSNQLGIIAQHQLNLLGTNDQHQSNLLGANNQYQMSQGSSEVYERPHKCPECPKRYKNKHDLTRHKKVHDKNKQIKCDVCQVLIFPTKHEYNHHMLTHTGEKLHKCPICSRWFGRLSSLKDHQYLHLKEKTFKCPKCPVARYFQSPHQLSNHMIYHKKEKQHECSNCHKKFHRIADLKVHERVHTKVKPFECDFCKKRFRTSGTLQTHIRLHTGEKPYECEFCDKSFTVSSNCTRHMKNCATRMENPNTNSTSVQNNLLTSDP